MNKFILILIPILILIFASVGISLSTKPKTIQAPLWEITSIDTVKFSRDLADQMKDNQEFDVTIDKQVSDIASTNTTHIAISTPYDQKYLPFLKRWVLSARNHNLKVWFRGNFSGWEGWFGYSKISSEEHKKLLEDFIKKNPDLFEDGDIFTSCPECENGGPGDPRSTGDVNGHRKFLIDEYNISLKSFAAVNKKVHSGFYSMNYDVANLVMDAQTTKDLGNIVVIDHYVKDPQKLALDAKIIAKKTGGKIVLGEFGAPIPDLHGDLTEEQQATWVKQALDDVSKVDEIIGINYWVNVGGSSKLWNNDGSKRQAVDILTSFFKTQKTLLRP